MRKKKWNRYCKKCEKYFKSEDPTAKRCPNCENKSMTRLCQCQNCVERRKRIIKAKQKEYEERPEIKAKRKEYRERPEIKAKQKEYD